MGLDAEIPDDEWFDELKKQLEGYKVRQNNRVSERERGRAVATVSHIRGHVAHA